MAEMELGELSTHSDCALVRGDGRGGEVADGAVVMTWVVTLAFCAFAALVSLAFWRTARYPV